MVETVPDNEHAEEFYHKECRTVGLLLRPVKPCLQRMIAMPSYRNRALGLQLFRYRISGFLHWGYNYWFNFLSENPLTRFPSRRRAKFPRRRPFLVYPGNDGKPMPSIRQLVLFDALQDLRAAALAEAGF
ncbi:MAG: DUF4091 domain-containing protein [Oscillospiraceae bacterium]